ncbi:MAG: cupin domain-containing protein [Alphaproteobacteria bacterium]
MKAHGLGLLVSVAAAILLSASAPASPGAAQQQAASPVTRTILDRREVPGANYEVVIAKVEIVPGGHNPRHTHPGAVMGYVLEGDFAISIAGGPFRSVLPGEHFSVDAGAVHEERAGAQGATAIAVFTVQKGKPMTSPAP